MVPSRYHIGFTWTPQHSIIRHICIHDEMPMYQMPMYQMPDSGSTSTKTQGAFLRPKVQDDLVHLGPWALGMHLGS